MVNAVYPATIAAALQARANDPSLVPYAGGTDWMVTRQENTPLLFLNGISSLHKICEENGSLIFGSCATYTELLESGKLPDILRQAIIEVASPAIRNLGTVGGNICNASPAGDTLPVLYALDARLRLSSINGTREIPIASFIQGVRKIDLAPSELLCSIVLPASDYTHSYYKKVGARSAVAISKVSFAGLIRIKDGLVAAIPMAFGSVAATIVRRPEIESTLIGQTMEDVCKNRAKTIAAFSPFITPINDQRSTAEYRKKVCLSLLDDFLDNTGE